MGCGSSSCDNPICQAAVQIQEELPFMDFNQARELAVGEAHMHRLKQQIKVQVWMNTSTRPCCVWIKRIHCFMKWHRQTGQAVGEAHMHRLKQQIKVQIDTSISMCRFLPNWFICLKKLAWTKAN